MATVLQAPPASQLAIKKIAVLTDFSQGADTALEYAARLARAYHASIILAHAYVPPAIASSAPEATLVYETWNEVEHNLEERLNKLTKAAFLRGIHCATMLHVGDPRDLLGSISDADLVVVGTAGESGLKKAALGSTAEAVFRSSRVPVLTIGPHFIDDKAKKARKTVLYATDFSSGAEMALPYATSIAREQDADLILLHVNDDKNASFTFERAMACTESLERLRVLASDHATGLTSISIVGFGTPEKVILEKAGNHHADLIVMGARGAGALAGLVSHLGGGTAYKVATNAACPVFTIRK